MPIDEFLSAMQNRLVIDYEQSFIVSLFAGVQLDTVGARIPGTRRLSKAKTDWASNSTCGFFGNE